jgi:signal transduction histidine kinase
LTAMTTNANAGLRWLGRETPDLDEAKASLQRIVNDGSRAGTVIENIRTIFQKDSGHRTAIDVSELVTETLELVRSELRTHRVFASTKFAARLPRVNGDQTRLQQVLLNLIANAIDAIATVQDRDRVTSNSVRPPRIRGRCHVIGGFWEGHQAKRHRPHLRSVLYDKTRRHGDGVGTWSLHSRGTRREPLRCGKRV